jgi:hypothetical protein
MTPTTGRFVMRRPRREGEDYSAATGFGLAGIRFDGGFARRIFYAPDAAASISGLML